VFTLLASVDLDQAVGSSNPHHACAIVGKGIHGGSAE
jgi:hypothetical protein